MDGLISFPNKSIRLKDPLREAYFAARLKAVRETGLDEETFPEECPWNLKEIFLTLEKNTADSRPFKTTYFTAYSGRILESTILKLPTGK